MWTLRRAPSVRADFKSTPKLKVTTCRLSSKQYKAIRPSIKARDPGMPCAEVLMFFIQRDTSFLEVIWWFCSALFAGEGVHRPCAFGRHLGLTDLDVSPSITMQKPQSRARAAGDRFWLPVTIAIARHLVVLSRSSAGPRTPDEPQPQTPPEDRYLRHH